MRKNESLKGERWGVERVWWGAKRAGKRRRNEAAMVVEGKYVKGTIGETEGRRRLWREGGGWGSMRTGWLFHARGKRTSISSTLRAVIGCPFFNRGNLLLLGIWRCLASSSARISCQPKPSRLSLLTIVLVLLSRERERNSERCHYNNSSRKQKFLSRMYTFVIDYTCKIYFNKLLNT